ncbi:unnamed protein product, partial [Rotaria magnacalcarata]
MVFDANKTIKRKSLHGIDRNTNTIASANAALY